MVLFGKDIAKSPVLIAEIGVNHEGDVDKAAELIGLAADAGADAVKFQSYTVERFISADDTARQERVAGFRLDLPAHERLKAVADDLGIAFFSSAITEDWVESLSKLGVEAIKIASGDIDFEPVIAAAAASGLTVLLSTGTATEQEVDRAVGWARSATGGGNADGRLVLMHCVSAYPTPLEEANLAAITTMRARYTPVPIGYSNHVMGREAPLAAVALGAQVVEVHFTDCKEGREFRDHALSADPDDLRYLADMLPQIAAARGDGVKRPQACEEASILAIRKGIIAARDLAVGDVLTEDALMFARPGTEIPATSAASILGRRLVRPVANGAVIPRDAVE